MKAFQVIVISVLLATSVYSQESPLPDSYNNLIPKSQNDFTVANTPENIILLIGDGMGLTQISSAFYYKESTPHYARFPNIGLMRTSSTVKITDSAAGATAFANGEKTYNGAIGVNADTVSIPNIVEILSKSGWKTGLISTSSITHATPACFFAHVKSRNMHEEIAAQLTTSEVDFFAGGGLGYFTDSTRADGQNYLKTLKKNDFKIHTEYSMENLKSKQKYAYLLGYEAMPTMLQGRGDFLPKTTQAAIDYLSDNNSNFFLMVEGSMIDWGGHAKDAAYLVSEMIDFDDAIGVALDYAEKSGNTLVIVTADHETGGFTLSSDSNYDEIKGTFSTGGHSTTLIPVAAYGPGSELFRGVYENTEIFHHMLKSLNQNQ